jgi:hypothetical protein
MFGLTLKRYLDACEANLLVVIGQLDRLITLLDEYRGRLNDAVRAVGGYAAESNRLREDLASARENVRRLHAKVERHEEANADRARRAKGEGA